MNDDGVYSLHEIQQNGFAVVKAVVRDVVLDTLTDAVESVRSEMEGNTVAAGIRYLLRSCPEVINVARSAEMTAIAAAVIGAGARPVRAIFFDKSPVSNWYVTWHQDLTIAVKEKVELQGFGPWSVKDAIPHVQPPVEVLCEMVSLRLHLDLCSQRNGAIKFIPGSHKAGVLGNEQVAEWRNKQIAVVCPAERGDVICMRPLILHSSSRSIEPVHRRVLHLEYAARQLPNGLEWSEPFDW
jgi:hypothetical protein